MKKIIFPLIIFLIIISFFVFRNNEPMLKQNIEILNNNRGRIVATEEIDIQNFIKDNFYNNSPEYWDKQLKKTEEFNYLKLHYSSGDSKPEVYMIRPKKEGDYPVLILSRSINSTKLNKERGMLWISPFASNDYIILSPIYKNINNFMESDKYICEDTQNFLDLFPMIKSLPYADENNIFMLGNSKGGMLTYQAIKEVIEGVDIKAAAITGAPTDLIQYYNDSIWGEQEAIKEKIGTPEENREAFVSKSPYYWPEKIDVPLLIQHGEKDKEIDVEHAIKLNDKLSNQNIDHKLITFPNGSHLLQKDSKIYSESIDNIYNWFKKYGDIESPF
jgi:dipeptidyl aminopeptidase/acylaminoacyl peptidase